MEKILTISIAAYNVEKYIRNTLDSLIIENMDKLEVLIIVDGGKDKTLEIAKEYEEKYPNTFKAVYKENGGYGSTINKGIELATGKYFKQLDGDDWFHTKNLNEICKELIMEEADVIYTPYIEHLEKNKEEITKRNNIEEVLQERNLETAIKNVSRNMSMYCLMYRTEILKKNKVRIDERCFYTDTEYAIFPLYYANTIKIFNNPLYIYRIGIEGQSMSIKGRLKHYKDHEIVDEKLIKKYNEEENKLTSNLKEYIKYYMMRVFSANINDFLLLLKPTKENFNHIKEFDRKILELDNEIFQEMEKYSKNVKLLRMNNYGIYLLCYFFKKVKIKSKYR